MSEDHDEDKTRLDKWLWAARFYKTRGLAAESVTGGKVHLNGVRTKPARALRIGDEITITQAPYEHVVIVKGLSARRGPAKEAALLYEETAESRGRREALREQMRLQPAPIPHRGPMTKKQRREVIRFKRGEFF
jgi:ribosome-associated heat shock protein Hsp15